MPGDEASRTVLDASIAIRWLVEEKGSDQARAILEAPTNWIAPRLLLTEAAAALRRKVVDGELSTGQATRVLGSILTSVDASEIRLHREETFAVEALELALFLRHKLPDCIYLTLAEREGAALATADRKLAELALRRGVRVLGVDLA
jgi:predicted nucleic acid-binding protein